MLQSLHVETRIWHLQNTFSPKCERGNWSLTASLSAQCLVAHGHGRKHWTCLQPRKTWTFLKVKVHILPWWKHAVGKLGFWFGTSFNWNATTMAIRTMRNIHFQAPRSLVRWSQAFAETYNGNEHWKWLRLSKILPQVALTVVDYLSTVLFWSVDAKTDFQVLRLLWSCLVHEKSLRKSFWQRGDVVLLSALISCCEKASEWQLALLLFGTRQSESTDGLSDCEPDVVLYNAMISALEKCGQWTLALDFVNQMQLQSLVPDGITYSAVISACEKGLQWQMALSILSLAIALSNEIDTIAFNSAISSVEKCGFWEIALILLQDMTQFSLADDISFNAAIGACEKGQQMLETSASKAPEINGHKKGPPAAKSVISTRTMHTVCNLWPLMTGWVHSNCQVLFGLFICEAMRRRSCRFCFFCPW